MMAFFVIIIMPENMPDHFNCLNHRGNVKMLLSHRLPKTGKPPIAGRLYDCLKASTFVDAYK